MKFEKKENELSPQIKLKNQKNIKKNKRKNKEKRTQSSDISKKGKPIHQNIQV